MISREVANTNVIVFGLTMQGYVPPRSTEQEEHANHYTTDAVAKVEQNALIQTLKLCCDL